MRILQVPVRCPSCGANTTAAPGVETTCPYCGARIYVPPPSIPRNPYEMCEGKTPYAAELLNKARGKWPLPPDLVAQLELLKASGAIVC
jgi:DNA-directed RNA polymerase subunit RPC12/RpoP